MFKELKKQQELNSLNTRLKKIEDKLNIIEKALKEEQKQNKNVDKKGISQ